jgi:CDP-diacylglycerol--glycerol-3-phosphate 3-phosphatidyltransferase
MLSAIPNLLTALRVAAAPFLFLFLWHRQWTASLLVIIAAAVTDFLDGYLARLWSANSRVGEVFDPIADKILLSGAFIALWMAGTVETWLAVVVLGRDVLILLVGGVALMIARKARRFPPSMLGKVSTGVQIALVIAIALQTPPWVVDTLKWGTAALALGSGLDYGYRYVKG